MSYPISGLLPKLSFANPSYGIVGGLLLLKDALSGKDIRSLSDDSDSAFVYIFLLIFCGVATFPWLWCVFVGLVNVVALPFAMLADGVASCWQWMKGNPEPKPDREKLRRIQKELEGMENVDYEQQMCPICLEDLSPPNETLSSPTPLTDSAIQRLKCSHLFHKACLQEWMGASASPTCPLCRAVIRTSTSEEEEEVDPQKQYQARLQFFIERLRAQQPSYSSQRRTNVADDVDYLYRNRRSDWYYWNGVRTPFISDGRHSWVASLPSFNDALQHSRQLASNYYSSQGSGSGSGRSSGGRSNWGGGNFRGGGGGGSSW